jgi:hypothetical protein
MANKSGKMASQSAKRARALWDGEVHALSPVTMVGAALMVGGIALVAYFVS